MLHNWRAAAAGEEEVLVGSPRVKHISLLLRPSSASAVGSTPPSLWSSFPQHAVPWVRIRRDASESLQIVHTALGQLAVFPLTFL
jgi:hypothetical protein